jgi:potassium efflux system protein
MAETRPAPRHPNGVNPSDHSVFSFILLVALPALAQSATGELGVLVRTALAVAILLVAGVLHWGMLRLSRRLACHQQRGNLPWWQRVVELILLLLRFALWPLAALLVSELFGSLRDLRAALAGLLEMSLTAPLFRLNERTYSALDLLELPAILAALWVVVSAFTRLLRMQVLRSARVDRGVQETMALLTRYVLMFIGGIIVLQAWGIDSSSLAIVGSVLGIGVGFGLQNIANNFVSGVVVSLERPVQPGDFVRVGDLTGTVERIGPRCVEIRTLDRVSILVPNSRFLETEVINWSHGDPVSRVHIPVGVAYGSDVSRVRAALLEAARGHPDVLRDPKPRVELRGFGDSSLNFELLVWTSEPRIQERLKSDLNYRVEASLRAHRVQIPFPQRDLHLRSPHLEQLVTAWSRRNFSPEELAQPNGADAPAHSDSARFEEDLGPRGWSDAELDSLVGRMRGAGGVEVLDRRHLLSSYPKCFVGREAVDWIVNTFGLSRDDAVVAGQLLIDRDLVHHVLDEHPFRDGNFFYRFRADE